MKNCQEISAAASRAMDMEEALPLGARLETGLHLLICKNCRAFSRNLHFLRTAMQRYDEAQSTATPTPSASTDTAAKK